MTRVIIVIDERETNTLVSNALEISLISYANRMQISTLLPYARAGVKRNVRLSLIELGITYDTRIRGRQGSWWTIDISSTRVIKS